MILITGMAGFIGSNLLKSLIERKEKIIGVDNLSIGNLRNIKIFLKYKNFKFIKKDVLSQNILKIRKFDTVFHLASLIDVRESFRMPSKYFSNIVGGSMNILELARKNDAKIVFTSSAAVYGDYRRKVKESDRPKPLSPYGFFKLTVENLIKHYNRIYGIDYTIFRLFNVYGENARTGIVKILLDSVRKKKTFYLFGDGSQKRDFVYVKDVCKILLNHHELNNDVFNVGTGRPISIQKLISLIQKISGKKIKIIKKPKVSGDIDYSCADNSKLLSKISYKFSRIENVLKNLI